MALLNICKAERKTERREERKEKMRQRGYRTIYMIEVFNDDCTDIIVRRFARNKRVAEQIGRELNKLYGESEITKLLKSDYQFIDMRAVEDKWRESKI